MFVGHFETLVLDRCIVTLKDSEDSLSRAS